VVVNGDVDVDDMRLATADPIGLRLAQERSRGSPKVFDRLTDPGGLDVRGTFYCRRVEGRIQAQPQTQDRDDRDHQREVASSIPLVLAEGSGPTSSSIIIFDCETTGMDRQADQIIELCVQRGLDDAAPGAVTTWRIKPAVPIQPGAQAVHGIAAADLEGCPAFAEVADAIAAAFASADVIVGYNLAFDIEMLQAEYARLALPAPDFTRKQVVDAFRLWQQFEPRSLQHAHVRFVGNGFTDAHSASADVAATARVLAGMLDHFNLAGRDWSQIASVCDPSDHKSWVGPSRHLRWSRDRERIVLAFGEHVGIEIAELDPVALATLAQDAELPSHVREVCRAACEQPADTLIAWVRERFG